MADIKFKGKTIITPKGEAKWCKVTEPDRKFNSKGTYSTDLVIDPNDSNVKKFIEDLDAMLEEAYQSQLKELAPAKAKSLTKRPTFKDEYDAEGNETGKLVINFAMKDVDDRDIGDNKIKVFDTKGSPLTRVPLVGNGSTIKVQAYIKASYMSSTNSIGISRYWKGLQIITLNSFAKGNAFEAEDGDFEAGDEVTTTNFTSEESDELDF